MDTKLNEVDENKIRGRMAAWNFFNFIAYCVFTAMVWTSEPSPYETLGDEFIKLGRMITVILPVGFVFVCAWFGFVRNSK